MKNVIRWGLAAGLAAALALSGNALAQGAASSERSSATGGAAAKKVDKKLQEKLEKVHAIHQGEIEMAQVATQNAQSPEVKQFAEQMQADHKKADEKLMETAQSIGVSLEGKTFQKENDRAKKDAQKLSTKTGKDFDKEYMSHMVKGHEKAVKEVESAAKDARKANQTELAALLEQSDTGIKSHLQHAKQVQKDVEKGGATRQGRRPSGTTGGPSGSMERGTPGSQTESGSRDDTGGPPPSGGSQEPGAPPGQTGGEPGTSSEGSTPPRQ